VSGPSQGRKLKDLLARPGIVLAVLGTPDAGSARIMETAGVEAAFIGTGITGGRYTGLGDTGLITATEALWIAKYIAGAVSFPIILDGDTGHGGPPAIRRLVHESIKIGLAGIRLDDQEIEAKRGTVFGHHHRFESTRRALPARWRKSELDLVL
jgi:2-methylisocitrate lyase-like PEP mutase family enzyme